MKVQLYAIFDNASGVYEKPFFSMTDDMVRREFLNAAMAADTPINKHPKDYSLWRLGNFDDNTGVVNDEANECLCTAMEIIAQSKAPPSKEEVPMPGLNSSKFPADYKPGLTD